jgi:hypothetical protein
VEEFGCSSIPVVAGGDVPTKSSRYDPFSWSLTNATAVSGSDREEDDDDEDDDDKDFRPLYMDMITDAFADVLEELQSSDTETLNVDVLVDCLQSGLELLNPEDKDILFRGIDDNDDVDDENDTDMDQGEEKMTPHEAHRRKLGFAL